jgi:ABC-type bacteriocin/lantibiotic exporter with double-glycine peptidase domain
MNNTVSKLRPKFHKQEFGYSGATACLRIALWAWGCELDEAELRRLSGCTPFGVSSTQLVETAHQLGFKASREYTFTSLSELVSFTQLHLNPIVYVDWWPLKGGLSGLQQALIVYEIELESVVVFNPLVGWQQFAHEEFLTIWREMNCLTIVVDIE